MYLIERRLRWIGWVIRLKGFKGVKITQVDRLKGFRE
jgi:hypothetical protein